MARLGGVLLVLLSASHLSSAQTTPSSRTIVSIPQEYTYLLPNGYTGNTNYTFANGTSTSNDSINSLLQSASDAPFISFDQEFLDILGPNPEVNLVAQRDNSFAYEMGVWVPERNEVWFTSAVGQGMTYPPTLYSLNLETNFVGEVNASQPITNPNGGYYYQGKIYIATYPDNQTYSGGVISVDAKTLQVETVLNSYFGLRFNGVDDITWASRGNKSYMFFTDLDFAYLGYPNLPPLQLPDQTWRWDPQAQVLLPALPRDDVNPNGIRVSPDMRTLYVTSNSGTFNTPGPYSPQSNAGAAFWWGPYIYAYDLNSDMFPVNRRLFGMARQGIADGLHVDDEGRVYTGEYEGVVVRNSQGKTIGIFNAQFFKSDRGITTTPVANFALAGDVLVVLAVDRLWTVKLGQMVVGRDSPIVN